MRKLMIGVGLIAGCVFSTDWPQYRGPSVDGSTPEKILTTWPTEGPKVVWKAPIGESFGSFAVAGGKAYIFIERGGDEVLLALNADTGKETWTYTVGKTIFDKEGGPGPRSTPTIDGGKVYVLSTYLKLVCLNAADGKEVWARDLPKEYGGTLQLQTKGINKWGCANSPLLDGDRIYIHGGGNGQALLAFDKKTGNPVWKTGDEQLTHSTPVPATIHGIRQVIFFCQSGLVSCAADSGSVLWKFPHTFNVSTASTPIVSGDIVYCSAGYTVGSAACRISKEGNGFKATELWRTPGNNDCNHWTTPVCKDGHLYGIFGFKDYVKPGANPGAPLKCIEIATGKEKWSKPGFGSGGGTILAGGSHILAQSDGGALVLVEATPAGYKEVARHTPLGGKCWTMAVVANGRIYARNTKEGICLDVAAK